MWFPECPESVSSISRSGTWCGTPWCSASSAPTRNTTRRAPARITARTTTEPLILNLQDKLIVNTSRLSEYVGELRWTLGLGRRDCNVCLVNDREMRHLNALFRGTDRATDVLAFPWDAPERPVPARTKRGRGQRRQASSGLVACVEIEFRNHLGDIVISVETAKRNA